MVLNIKRFTKNNFFVEKNPTIVNFPVKNLELKDVIPVPKGKSGQEVPSKYNLVANICHEGKHMEGTLKVHVHRKSEDTWYVCLCPSVSIDVFVSASVREGPQRHLRGLAEAHSPHRRLPRRASDFHSEGFGVFSCWWLGRYEVQDLNVTDILPQQVVLSEAYMQIYELQRS